MEAGTLFAEHYQLLKLIGEGSFGNVWLAQDTKTDLTVALKIYVALDERGIREFMEEFKLTFNLNHTHILHAYHYDVCGRQPFLVMPYCENGSAVPLIGNAGEERVWQLMADVSAGLAYLHGLYPNAILHQDIKPDNILIGKGGQFLVTDFGISQRMRSTLRRNSTTAASAGTTAYMPPERFLPKAPPSPASDIWALGATVVEIATGELPFCGMGGSMQNGGAELPELPGFSNQLKEVVHRCLARNPAERPTAAQLLEWCRNAPLSHTSQRESPSTAPRSAARIFFEKHRKTAVAVAIACAMVLSGGSIYSFVAGSLQADEAVAAPLAANYSRLLPGYYTCKQQCNEQTVGRDITAHIQPEGPNSYKLSLISVEAGTQVYTFRALPDGSLESEQLGKGCVEHRPHIGSVSIEFQKNEIGYKLYK